MSTPPDPTEEVQIKNSTQSSLALMVPTMTAKAEDGTGAMVYGQDLELLTAVEGGTVIPAGSTKTFVLYQTTTDPNTGKPVYAIDYDLLPCTANWYFTVANIPVLQGISAPDNYGTQTVTDDSIKAFQNAAKFIQTISAYPTSTLATGYQKALGDARDNASGKADGSADSSSAVSKSLTGTVDDFFKSTKDYQNVTLDKVVNIQAYYGMFPFVWAKYATGTTTYYLYSSNGSATKFVGTISLTPPTALDVTVANAGYTCTFTPASNGSDTTTVNVDTSAAKSLTYVNGTFVDDVNSDVPMVGIQGTFQIKSLFTGKLTDTDIIPVLTGTVGGATCIGFDQAQLSSDPTAEFWDTLFHPKNSMQVFQSIMEIGGALFMVIMAGQLIYQLAGAIRAKIAGKQPTTKELLDALAKQIEQSNKQLYDKATSQVTGGKGKLPASRADADAILERQIGLATDNVSAGKLVDALNAAIDNLTEVAKYMEIMNTQQKTALGTTVRQARDGLKDLLGAPTDDIGAIVTTQTTGLPNVRSNVGELVQAVDTSLSVSERGRMETNISTLDTTVTEMRYMAEWREETGPEPKTGKVIEEDILT
jgi:hypothetical protein